LPDLTRDNLWQYVRIKLGGSYHPIEIGLPELDVAIQDSLDLFNHYVGEFEFRVEKNISTGTFIDLSTVEGLKGVVSVRMAFPEQDSVYTQMNIFELMYRMVFPRMPVGEWYQLRMFYEMYQKVRGTDPDWRYDPAAKRLWVDCHSGPYDVAMVLSKELTLEGLNKSRPMYKDLFKSAALAFCKQMLARVRGKWGDTIPAPPGTMSTDAAALRDEAGKEIEAVRLAVQGTSDAQVAIFG